MVIDDDYDPDFDPGLAEPAGPPRPDVPVTFSQGPYSGMPVDAVLEDPEGRAWVRRARVEGQAQRPAYPAADVAVVG